MLESSEQDLRFSWVERLAARLADNTPACSSDETVVLTLEALADDIVLMCR